MGEVLGSIGSGLTDSGAGCHDKAHKFDTLLQKQCAGIECTPVYESKGLLALLKSPTPPSLHTWDGAFILTGFPSKYVELRLKWQKAAEEADWITLVEIIERQPPGTRHEWFNLPNAFRPESGSYPWSGYTVLHLMAYFGPPRLHDAQWYAWKILLDEISMGNVWKSVQMHGSSKTAYQIAKEQGHDKLAMMFEPVFKHPLDPAKSRRLDAALSELAWDQASQYIDRSGLWMPSVSVLREMYHPELWVPLPHTTEGFIMRLEGECLHVRFVNDLATVHNPASTSSKEFRLHG